jgi:uncharacterized membrane protein YcaP (DUF421 family)
MSDFLHLALRAMFAYIFLFAVTWLMGKRELSQLTFRDFIVGITIGSIAGKAAVEPHQKLMDYVPAFLTVSGMQILFSYISLKSHLFRAFTDGEPIILIQNGKILEKNLKKVKLNVDELVSQLRQKNVFKLTDVEYALIEPNGGFSVMLKANKEPLNAEVMQVSVSNNELPRLVIKDGKLIKEELRRYDFTEAWLRSELKKQNIFDISHVMLAQIDKTGMIYADVYETGNESICDT